ncbi:Abi family protein [Planococcus maitriensis]|uniref:Abi family protein n=1 Tax=Planococcus maitriensis TaxID=221799 RepID=A0A365K555_9BACL|nr:Abi family protein [Planococcus maitriensis]RAZ67302.1 Abi family protein [Planococcus maitriensis]
MKSFATHDEQLAILKSRGLVIEDEAAARRVLSRDNYYALIDGYKEPFLERDETKNPYGEEMYEAGTAFNHILALYQFDRKLRLLLLSELLKFERSIKSKLAYRFSERFPEVDSFLDSANYSPDNIHFHERDRITATLNNLIESHRKRHRVRYPELREFYEKHKNLPLWVLVNFLSLGQITNFYTVIDQDLRTRIAQDFADDAGEHGIELSAAELDEILSIAFPFRNKAAHEEVLYSFRLRSPLELTRLEAKLHQEKGYITRGTTASLIKLLKVVSPPDEYEVFTRELLELIRELEEALPERPYVWIMKEAGFRE